LAWGIEFYRFQSNVINGQLSSGTNTTVTTHNDGWLAVRGDIVNRVRPPQSTSTNI